MGNQKQFSVNILGAVYTIKIVKKHRYLVGDSSGATEVDKKDIYILKDTLCRKKTIRHEILHAFLYESGLGWNTFTPSEPWAVNEEMVDWFAVQAPKICAVYEQLDLL